MRNRPFLDGESRLIFPNGDFPFVLIRTTMGIMPCVESGLRRLERWGPMITGVRALVFDVFGTVVDWRTSIIQESAELGRAKGIEADWGLFADAWRGRYRPFMDRVRHGEIPWTNVDALHRMALDELLTEFGISYLNELEKDELNRAWHRLQTWPDSVPGLARLKHHFVIATLSNGNVALLTKHGSERRTALGLYPIGWTCPGV